MSLVVTIIVSVLYSGFIYGIVPTSHTDSDGNRVSWEGHLIGIIVGGLWCWLFQTQIKETSGRGEYSPVADDIF